MASKTNCTINGKDYYRIKRKIGKNSILRAFGLMIIKPYGKNKTEAEAKFEAFMDNQKKGVTNKTLFFGEMMDTFIKEIFLKDSRYSDSTKTRYVNTYNNLKQSDIVGLPLSSIKSIDLQVSLQWSVLWRFNCAVTSQPHNPLLQIP